MCPDNSGPCYSKIVGRHIELGNGKLKIKWTKQGDEYSARVAGGIWFNNKGEWIKAAELAEGEYCFLYQFYVF